MSQPHRQGPPIPPVERSRTVIETDDRQEGITAFNEKRDPQWKNR